MPRAIACNQKICLYFWLRLTYPQTQIQARHLVGFSMPIMETDGFLYGPNKSGKTYKSLNYHRNTPKPNKSRWLDTFSRDEEFDLFCGCDAQNWVCASGNYWGTINGKRLLGTQEERFSFCPSNSNSLVPWHGYPIKSASRDYRVPDQIVDLWLNAKVIDGITAKRIRSAKI